MTIVMLKFNGESLLDKASLLCLSSMANHLDKA